MRKFIICLLILTLPCFGIVRKFSDGSDRWYLNDATTGMYQDVSQNFAIGQITTNYKLEVNGTISANAFIADTVTGTCTTANFANTCTTADYLVNYDSNVVTASYSGAVTLSNMSNFFYGDGSNLSGVVADSVSGDVTVDSLQVNNSLTENVWIDVMYLNDDRTPGVGQLDSGMEYLSFDSGSSQNCKVQVEVPYGS